ncbi:MAG: hypothetical protein Q8858_15230 [Bacteroidota bacterium]|nr:hypothetical protein [Bacteroidota bacterium]MDP4194029.1 hypothetical protein [Bacteroidota bacterium]
MHNWHTGVQKNGLRCTLFATLCVQNSKNRKTKVMFILCKFSKTENGGVNNGTLCSRKTLIRPKPG